MIVSRGVSHTVGKGKARRREQLAGAIIMRDEGEGEGLPAACGMPSCKQLPLFQKDAG